MMVVVGFEKEPEAIVVEGVRIGREAAGEEL